MNKDLFYKNLVEKLQDKIDDIVKHMMQDDFISHDDLEFKLVNEDYYEIYTDEAREELNNFDVFDAFGEIIEWEIEVFGEIQFKEFNDPVKALNLLVYTLGYNFLQENYQEQYSVEDIESLKEKLEDYFLK